MSFSPSVPLQDAEGCHREKHVLPTKREAMGSTKLNEVLQGSRDESSFGGSRTKGSTHYQTWLGEKLSGVKEVLEVKSNFIIYD